MIEEGTTVEDLMALLFSKGIQSVLVEGGAATHRSFIDSDCWDECYLYTGKKIIEEGVPAPPVSGVPTDSFYLGSDLIQIFRNV